MTETTGTPTVESEVTGLSQPLAGEPNESAPRNARESFRGILRELLRRRPPAERTPAPETAEEYLDGWFVALGPESEDGKPPRIVPLAERRALIAGLGRSTERALEAGVALPFERFVREQGLDLTDRLALLALLRGAVNPLSGGAVTIQDLCAATCADTLAAKLLSRNGARHRSCSTLPPFGLRSVAMVAQGSLEESRHGRLAMEQNEQGGLTMPEPRKYRMSFRPVIHFPDAARVRAHLESIRDEDAREECLGALEEGCLIGSRFYRTLSSWFKSFVREYEAAVLPSSKGVAETP